MRGFWEQQPDNVRANTGGASLTLFHHTCDLDTPKIRREPLKINAFKQSVKQNAEQHQKTPFINIVFPVCLGRSHNNDVYSAKVFADLLKKIDYTFNGIKLRIDIVLTGELEAWNIMRDHCTNQRKRSMDETSVFPVDNITDLSHPDSLATATGQSKADEWEKAISLTLEKLNSKGHEIRIRHWTEFSHLDAFNHILQNAKHLYAKSSKFALALQPTLTKINGHLQTKNMLIQDIANPFNLQYVLAELTFQTYLKTFCSNDYQIHLYEVDDTCPYITAATEKYSRELLKGLEAPSHGNSAIKFLEFKYNASISKLAKAPQSQPDPNKDFLKANKQYADHIFAKYLNGEQITEYEKAQCKSALESLKNAMEISPAISPTHNSHEDEDETIDSSPFY